MAPMTPDENRAEAGRPPTVRERVAERLRAALPEARVEVVDLTGTDDHLEARVVSPEFRGMNAVERHRRVYAPLKDWIEDDTIHALAVRAWTPEQIASTPEGGTT